MTNGLLDFLQTPAGQGILAAGMGYAANARKGAPLNSLGAGGLLGLQAYGGAQQSQLEQAEKVKAGQMRDLQLEQSRFTLDEARRKSQSEQGLMNLQTQFLQPGTQAQGGTSAVNSALPPQFQIGAQAPIAAQAPKFDVQGYTAAAQQRGYMSPLDAFKLQKSMATAPAIKDLEVKDFTPASVQKFRQTGDYSVLERLDKLHFADGGGATLGLNPFTGQQISAAPKSGNPFTDLIVSNGQGGFQPNSPLIAAKQGIARAGASRTDVRVENKMGDSLAKEIGPMMSESAGAATGAAAQIDAANRVISAVDSNKIYAGPGATIRLRGAQIADLVGAGGKDTSERIANTRQTVRGLAEMTLQGRKQMRGQGAITESESKLAERAISGDIDDLTAAEIKQLAQASARSARFVHQQHQKKLEVVRGNPNMSQLAPFYEAQPLPEAAAPAAPAMKPNYIFRDGKLVPAN